jgi:hypothetical protein
MAFLNPIVFPPNELQPGSCQAVRIKTAMSGPVERCPVTPEWCAENERKQLAFEAQRAKRRKELGVVDTAAFGSDTLLWMPESAASQPSAR